LAEDPPDLAKQQLDRYSGLSNYSGTMKPLSQIAGLVTQESTTEDNKENSKGEIIKRLQDATRGVTPTEDTPYITPQASRGRVVVTGRTDH
jgi:hypothetical protein